MIICAQKRLIGGKSLVLHFGAFFYAQNFFVKKKKIVVLITSHAILLTASWMATSRMVAFQMTAS